MNAAGSLTWLAGHELRLAWRDWRDMVTAGGKRGLVRTLMMFLLVALAFHLPVWAIVSALGLGETVATRTSLIATSVLLALFASLLVSQAMETVTRSLYTRGDLDLVLSSPVSLKKLFTVRLITNTVPIALLAVVLALPLINVLALSDGPRWLAGLGVAAAFGASASALAVLIIVALFQLLGPARTRLIAQIVAALIGATFAISIQIIAIVQLGSLASNGAIVSTGLQGVLPIDGSFLWIPARAALGDMGSLALMIGAAALLVVAVVMIVAPRLADISMAAAALVPASRRRRVIRRAIAATPRAALRYKEWVLLRRDPWLVSQTLTQLLYLIPPALLLSRSLGGGFETRTVVVMVLVTVSGQLAGALAWLAISGEDAPELVASAPVNPRAITRAKIEAVLTIVSVVLAPLLIGFALLSPGHALVAAAGAVLAGMSTVRIQLWFRSQADRSHFRRRHTSSRIATFAEAMTSFSWALAAGMLANQSRLSLIFAGLALLILAGARALSPRAALA
jgi:ABC-2 type transport system permease protein